jgi:hypothetical protein
MSEVVRRFLSEKSPDRHVTVMTIEEAEHLTAEQRQRIIAQYPAHERDARTKGAPLLGSGRIFPIAEEQIVCEPFEIPNHWFRIGAMDFGWDHPFAAVELAWDADQDIVYVVKAHRLREATPSGWHSWMSCSVTGRRFRLPKSFISGCWRAIPLRQRRRQKSFVEAAPVGGSQMLRNDEIQASAEGLFSGIAK